MRNDRAALLAVLFAASCGPRDENKDGIADGVREPNNVSLVAPSTPVGTLSGQVLNTRLAPLPEASITLTLGGHLGELKTTSDAEGAFSFARLPAGSTVLITITKAGHATVRTSSLIPAAAGEFPINNANASVGPFTLTQLNGSLKFMVVTRSGRPATGARVMLEASPAGTLLTGSRYGTFLGMVLAQDGTVNDAGWVSFGEIPSVEELARLGGQYALSVSAFDENGDGVPEFKGTAVLYPAASLLADSSPRLIELADLRTSVPLAIAASGVGSMISFAAADGTPQRNMIRPGESLHLVFNQEVQDSSLLVLLTDEHGLENLGLSRSLSNGQLLTIQPAVPVVQGKEYNLAVLATSLENGSTFSRAGYFFGGDPLTPKPFAASSIQYQETPGSPTVSLTAGEKVIITFNQPIRLVGSKAAEAQLNYDFDNSGQIGDSSGELGNAAGFPIADAEPTSEPGSLFTLAPSGYTTRFQFTFAGAVGVPPQTELAVSFKKLLSAQSGYQTLWGTLLSSDESAKLQVAP